MLAPLPSSSSFFLLLPASLHLQLQRRCDRLFSSFFLTASSIASHADHGGSRPRPSTMRAAASLLAAARGSRSNARRAVAANRLLSASPAPHTKAALFSFFFSHHRRKQHKQRSHRLGWRILGQLRITGKLACLCFPSFQSCCWGERRSISPKQVGRGWQWIHGWSHRPFAPPFMSVIHQPLPEIASSPPSHPLNHVLSAATPQQVTAMEQHEPLKQRTAAPLCWRSGGAGSGCVASQRSKASVLANHKRHPSQRRLMSAKQPNERMVPLTLCRWLLEPITRPRRTAAHSRVFLVCGGQSPLGRQNWHKAHPGVSESWTGSQPWRLEPHPPAILLLAAL
ncbi:hypothetical protein J3F83DRAFT_538328 [Trichoderma novae-zelandiae]